MTANYSSYRTDRLTAGGATAVNVRNGICHHVIQLPPLATLEATGVVVHASADAITFVAASRPPSRPLDPADIDALLSLRGQVFVTGDFNSKHVSWNSRITNAAGRCLLRVAERHHALGVGPYDPTIFPAGGLPDIIAVVKGVPHQITATTRTALSSDNVPVVFDIDLDALQQPRRDISLAGIDWDRFQAAVTDSLAAATPPVEAGADAALLHFAATTNDAANIATPPRPRTPPDYSRQLPPDILAAITEKSRLYREWQRTRNDDTKRLLNRMRRDIRAAIDDRRHRDWTNKVATLCLDDSSARRTTKRFLRRTQRIPPLMVHGQAVCEPAAKADALADVFEAAFTPIEDPTDAVHDDLVAERLPHYF
ncbi:uncharacterized protein LOC124712460 [Schistocerca piceifrons]|uniref:uncharacterized protein LOC124712460 n=1 Tax=Schistocerca piceifrons TaxID=274613 RepID=UPI001F5EB8F8|nr:uncharacterized protein LOC124712460 [Schistocerca piceifrons]